MNRTGKRSTPPFYQQETPDSCVPACLRMVLAGLGLHLDEAELRALCDCTWLGTDALKAVDAARSLGFAGSAKHTLNSAELEEALAQGHFPIVFVELSPIDQSQGQHAFVALALSPSTIEVYDPEQGRRTLSRETFELGWGAARNLTILISL
jgi:ABC-type bacteriocin/lantibiotic exporter with double-glycine peptidase domain